MEKLLCKKLAQMVEVSISLCAVFLQFRPFTGETQNRKNLSAGFTFMSVSRVGSSLSDCMNFLIRIFRPQEKGCRFVGFAECPVLWHYDL